MFSYPELGLIPPIESGWESGRDTLFDFSIELTKVCVELVWRLCLGVEFVWILNFGFIPTFGVILGLIVGWFYAMFLACFVPCIWHVLWPQLGG